MTSPGAADPPNEVGPESIVTSLIRDERLARAAVIGVPSFVRRAQAVEAALAKLHATIGRERSKRLESLLPAGRLAFALQQRRTQLPASVLRLLEVLTREPKFFKRSAAGRADARRVIKELSRRVDAFNERWETYIETVSLGEVHAAQQKYNRYYALEREAALRRLPPQRFTPLELSTREELRTAWPPLERIKR